MAHVLIVDHDPSVRRLLVEIMSLEGHTISVAEDASLGLALLRAALYPLVVILSHLMPTMTGADLMDIVASDTHLATTHEYILVSAVPYEMSFAQINARLPQPAPFLAEPFTCDTLLTTVEAAAGRIETRTLATVRPATPAQQPAKKAKKKGRRRLWRTS